jgi:hypothetical protein
MSNPMVDGKPVTRGENVFVTICIIVLFPFVLIGKLFDVLTGNRTLYINVDKPWEMHLADRKKEGQDK